MPDRRPNQRSSIYRGQDGWWHGWVTLVIRDDGSPDRRHRMGRTEAEVTRKVRDLERARDTGRLASLGKGLTVGQWMEIWLTTIALRRIRRSTLESTYTPKVRNRIIPGLGKHRLDRLTPEHIERSYTQLDAEGLAPAAVLQIHRILFRATQGGDAARVRRPERGDSCRRAFCSPSEIEPLTPAETQRLVALAMTRRNGSRWSVALAPGLRHGEALGLRWQYVDLDAGTISIRWQLQRQRWRHGCGDPATGAKDRHTNNCPPGCTGHARTCPKRTGGGVQLAELKSDKSRRMIALPAPLTRR